MNIKALKAKLMATTKPKSFSSESFVSTGSTLMNLSISDNPYHGFPMGAYVLLVGDSASGKTWLSMNCLAEAASNPVFDPYRFIRNDPERGALMNVGLHFGEEVERRLELPEPSDTLQDFYYHIHDVVKKGIPFIYILDSIDALSSEESDKKFNKRKSAKESGEKETGSFGDGKAKINSENLRRLIPILDRMNSILIIINQTRDNLGFGFEKKTRSGGNALRFYATIEAWSSIVKTHAKTVRGSKVQTGIDCQIKIKKNRIQGNLAKVKFPIFHSYGIDDISGCIDWLVEFKHWRESAGIINAPEFDFKGSRLKLLRMIENEELEDDLRVLVGKQWLVVRAESRIKRKPRY